MTNLEMSFQESVGLVASADIILDIELNIDAAFKHC